MLPAFFVVPAPQAELRALPPHHLAGWTLSPRALLLEEHFQGRNNLLLHPQSAYPSAQPATYCLERLKEMDRLKCRPFQGQVHRGGLSIA
jgi:hypothetical protein